VAEHPVEPGQPAEHPEAHATVEHGSNAGHHAEPTAFGLTAPMFIGLAMIVVLAILAWKKVPAAIGRALDSKIALIRDQLAEAEALRKEAEALKAEYQAKAQSADAEAAAMIERAQGEAQEIVAKAKTDAEALIERRGRMAEDKIAAEERLAIKQLRAGAADAAARAAARLIAERDDPAADERLVNQTIAELPSR
jgi:F-type H+-transporting ATPase subunit b